MPYFAFMGFDHPPHSMPLRDQLRPEHHDYVIQHDQAIRCAGALYDAHGNQCGSLIIFEADNATQVWNWFRDEPFFKGGVYKESQVIEWRLAFNQLDRAVWP